MKKIWLLMIVCLLLVSFTTGLQAEKVVKLPYFREIPSLVPYYWQAQHILAQGTIFEGLYGYAPDPSGLGQVKVVPVIAEKATVSPDGREWTITLRKDKKWSNGDPITAYDFEWTYKYMCDPAIPEVPLWANHLQHVYNGWTAKAGGCSLDELGVKATGKYTLVFKLAYPRFDFNCSLVTAGAVPLHRATVEKWGQNEWWKPEHFVGNGPYIPASWSPNKETVLVKNKNYVGTCGNVDKIIIKNYADDANEIIPFQTGELDFAWVRNIADYAFVKKQSKLKRLYNETPMDLFWSGYQMTRGFNEIMDNVKVRQAFAMAIDRDLLCKTVLNGRAIASGSYWSKNDVIGKKMKEIKFSPGTAKRLLAEAGYPNGKGLPKLKFYITGNMPEVEFIVQQWKKNLGIDVKIEILESGVYWNYVWASWTPNLDPGFTRINCPMNSFEISTLDKNTYHVPLFYDYPAKVRKQDYDWEEERKAFLTKEGGTKDSDWATLVDMAAKLAKTNKEMVAKEPNKKWVEEMTRKPIFEDQFKEVYDNYKKAKTDKEKTDQWRLANRIILNEQRTQLEYNGMNETNKQARRLRYDMTYSQFDKAIEIAPKEMQIIQDTYFMVPLYNEKAQYVANSKLSGIMIYKFSWGPAIFNLKYLNLK